MFKKIRIIIFTFFLFIIGSDLVSAASISISSDKSSVVMGNTVTFTVIVSSSDNIGQAYGTVSASSNLTLLSGSSGTSISYFNGNNESKKSLTYIYKYKANSSGTATLTVTGLEIGNLETGEFEKVDNQYKSISIINSSNSSNSNSNGTTTEKKEYSTNNNLLSLEIEDYSIDFKKDVTEYKLTVDQSIEKLKVKAVAEDSKASITGGGEVNLSLGENTIEIKVTAENGNEKKYIIKVTVEDQNPIEVIIAKEKYTVVKKNNDILDKLEGYEEQKILIAEQEVISYKNSKNNLTLVILKDSTGKSAYYIYDDGSYILYEESTFSNVKLFILDMPEKKIPIGYSKYKFRYSEKEYSGYKLYKDSDYFLVYAMNLEDGKKGLYIYDSKTHIASRYDDKLENYYFEQANQKIKKYEMIVVGIIGVNVLAIIVTIIVSINKSKKNRRLIKKIFRNF